VTLDWQQIVEQHGPTVWRTIDRLLPDAADAADCFQRTFLSAWEFSQEHQVQCWPALLTRFATARALERCRELARQRQRLCAISITDVIDPQSGDPLVAAEATELEECLRIALSEIDPLEAEVFCLARLENLSYRDVGSQLGVTPNHVGVLLNRARSQLRARLRCFVSNPDDPTKEDAQ
jgi:RNA polymerase sigma factor (sigma-70 family)